MQKKSYFKLKKKNSNLLSQAYPFYYQGKELWFKSETSGIEKKLTEKNYVIDGWDR